MDVDECRELISYNDWANERVFDALADLTQDEWTKELGGSFGSIRGTAAHLVAAEWVWLERWEGESPEQPPEWLAAPAGVQLRDILSSVEADRRVWLAALADSDLDERRGYRLLDGRRQKARLSTQIRHVVNHSTYHRGQLATLLRMSEKVPPSTDLVVWEQQQRL